MANHVATYVRFEKLNDAGLERLNNLMSERVRGEEDGEGWFPDLFVDGTDVTYDMVEEYGWTTENVGAKWCHIENYDPDDGSFSLNSAWATPETGLEKLMEMVGEVDPDLVAYISYTDEMPNFIGANVMTKDGVEEYEEWSYDELRDIMLERVEGLKDEYDAETEEFTEEGNDMFWEYQYEIIEELQDSFLNEEGPFYVNGEHKE